MKKFVALFLIILIAFSAISCEKKQSGGESFSESAPESSLESEYKPENSGESQEISGEESVDLTPVDEDWQSHFVCAGWLEEDVFANALNRENREGQIPIFLLDTLEDVEEFKGYFTRYIWDKSWDEVKSFDEVTQKYDKEYYKTQSLLVVYIGVGSGTYRYGLDKVEIQGDTLNFYARQTNYPSAITCDMAGWFLLVEVHDSTVKHCQVFNAFLEENKSVTADKLPAFSYEEESKQYKDGQSGVKTEGFINNGSRIEIPNSHEAISYADSETTMEWNQATVYYDTEAQIYKVVLSVRNEVGGCCTVYITKDRVTKLIVYGE